MAIYPLSRNLSLVFLCSFFLSLDLNGQCPVPPPAGGIPSVQEPCPAVNADGVYDKDADIIITTYHSHIARSPTGYVTWGEDMAATGLNATVMTDVTCDNGYEYSGTALMAAVSGNSAAQAFLLSDFGLWSWGPTNEVVGGTIVTAQAFSSMTMPAGVTPQDVLDIKANSDVFFLVTNSGEVYLAGQNVTDVSGNASTTANTWHQVETAPGVPLSGVVQLSGSREVVYVLRSDGSVWTWGDGIALGNGAAVSDATYAAMVDPAGLPAGVTLSQLGTYYDNTSNSSGVLALGSDTKVYGIGYSGAGRLINSTTGFVSSWAVLQDSAGNDITDVLCIATSENSEEYATAGIITAGVTNDLFMWGEANAGNISFTPNAIIEFPTIPNGFTSGTDDPSYVSIGGHASSYFNRATKSICFTGHIVDGSGGNLQTNPNQFSCFDQAHPNWEPDINLCAAGVLPVELISFQGNVDGNDVGLNWSTATEDENEKFEIEVSYNGIDYEQLDSVEGAGTTDVTQYYSYSHNNVALLGSELAYYRLKQVDFSGQYEYSDVVLIQFDDVNLTTRIFPNPVIDGGNSGITVISTSINHIDLSDIRGRLIFSKEYNNARSVVIPMRNLNSGLYVIRINHTESIKVVVQ